MKKIITLVTFLSLMTACNMSDNQTPVELDYCCLDAQYIAEYEGSGLPEFYLQFEIINAETRSRSNRKFFDYMVSIDQFDVIREFYKLVDKEYKCLNPDDFKSLHIAYLYMKDKE